MIVFLDTSVWVDDLRAARVRPFLTRIRARFLLRFHSVVAGELIAGCRSKKERRALSRFLASFEATGRMIAPTHEDFVRAGDALSRLRQSGQLLANPGGALLDALQAATARRQGALLITHNLADFERLRAHLPLRIESWNVFTNRLAGD